MLQFLRIFVDGPNHRPRKEFFYKSGQVALVEATQALFLVHPLGKSQAVLPAGFIILTPNLTKKPSSHVIERVSE